MKKPMEMVFLHKSGKHQQHNDDGGDVSGYLNRGGKKSENKIVSFLFFPLFVHVGGSFVIHKRSKAEQLPFCSESLAVHDVVHVQDPG